MKKKTIYERIMEALATGERDYYRVMLDVFPSDDYPRAWYYNQNGGPPGCAMAFVTALRKMKIWRDHNTGRLWLPSDIEVVLKLGYPEQ